MKTRRLLLFAIPALLTSGLSACAPKYDVKLVVYNWADYIYDGRDENGRATQKSTIKLFEEYYKEKYDLVLKVQYRTFSTPEIMYGQIKNNRIKPDLICPSDYMIQKMANEDMLEKFSYNESTSTYGDSLKNFQDYGSPFIKERFASVKLKDGNSFLSYAVPYFWGTMGFTYDPEYFSEEEIGTWEALWSKDKKFQNQNIKTRLMEWHSADYDVNKFFYDANFLGEAFELFVMQMLLSCLPMKDLAMA